MMEMTNRKKPFKADMAAELFGAVASQARQLTFFNDYKVPDTPQGRFEMLALHLALMLRRLKCSHVGEREKFPSLTQDLCDWAVADLEESLSVMRVSDLKVSHYLKGFIEGFYGRLVVYDKALELNDKDMLEKAIRANVYGIVDKVEPYIVEGLAAYARQTWDWLQETGIRQIIHDLKGD